MIGSLIATIFSGGVTGIVGGAIQSVFGWLNRKQDIEKLKLDHTFQIDMIKANSEVMKLEWEQRAKVATIEAESRADVAASEAFKEGFKNEPKMFSEKVNPSTAQGWLLVLLDFIRGVIRPGLTLYLCAIATMMYFEARAVLAMYGLKDLPMGEAIKIHGKMTDTLLYLFSTCVCWWFYTQASRNKSR